MRGTHRFLTLLTAITLTAISAATAQSHPQTRKGFWIGFGLGYGSLGLEGASEREGAISGYLKMGGTVGPKLLLGGESNGWVKDDLFGNALTVGNASFTAYYYPNPESGLLLRGGIGFATYQVEGFDAETGVGLVFGIGYDARVGANTSITPVLNFNWGDVGAITQSVVQLAVGVTFH